MTIKDIARLAGVSIATVSRVLNGQSGVSESKRQKVMQIAEGVHYSPNRYSQQVRSQTPHLLVLQVDQTLPATVEEDILHACLEALGYFQNQELKIEFFAAEELPQALELLTDLQVRDESLEGLLIIGPPPESLTKAMKYLRGKGCPLVLTSSGQNAEVKMVPVNVIEYDKHMYYRLLSEQILATDKQRNGLYIHESKRSLSGEGFLSDDDFHPYLAELAHHYPKENIFIHNKGRFTPNLLNKHSCIVADSIEASEAISKHFDGAEERPVIISFGMSEWLEAALAKGALDRTIVLSAYELAFCSMAVLLQRLLLKRTHQKELFVYPRVYSRAMLPLLNETPKYPALLTTMAYNEKS